MGVKTGLANALQKPGLSPLESLFRADFENVIHHISLNLIYSAS